MNDTAKNKILELNKVFYQDIAKDFSRTRQTPWKGWELILKYFPNKENLKVLDVACGNAGFYPYLLKYYKNSVDYTGLDITSELLEEARNNYKSIKIMEYDVISHLEGFNHKYDLVVAFGIAHHIPSTDLRKKWFFDLGNLLNPNGILIVTPWDYIKTVTDTVKNKIVATESTPIQKIDLDEGDYFLWWGSSNENIRYCHDYLEEELEIIINLLEKNSIKLISRFKADGKENNLNTYLVFHRE